jgi:hypothetical protein
LTPIDALLLFIGGFASVFTLGFQSRVVNAGNYKAAAFMSFTIAMLQAHLWRLIVEGENSILSGAIYGVSGAMAITSAMFVHARFFHKPKLVGE